MSKKIIIFSAVTYAIGVFSLAVAPNTYDGVPPRMSAASTPLDLGYVPGELLVRFAPKPDGRQRSKAEKSQIVGLLGPTNVTKDYGNVPGLSHVRLPPGVTVEHAMERLNKTHGIMYAQPNHYLMLTGQKFPDPGKDPDFDKLWGMHNIGQYPPGGTSDADIDAPHAWDIETDANDVIVT